MSKPQTPQDIRKEFSRLTHTTLSITGVLDHDYTHWLEHKLIQANQSLKEKAEIDQLMDLCETPCCPKCGSEDILITIYCNECQEAL